MLFFGISLKVLAVIASVVVVGGSTTAILVTQLKEAEKPSANIFNTLVRDQLIEKIKNKSIEEIKTWQPTDEEKIVIATNFSSIIKHAPNEFFTRLKDTSFTKAPGIRYIQTIWTSPWLYIPFLKSELKSDIKMADDELLSGKVLSREAVGVSPTGEVSIGKYIPDNRQIPVYAWIMPEHQIFLRRMTRAWVDRTAEEERQIENYKYYGGIQARLTSIMNGESTPEVRVPDGTGTTSATTQKEKAIAKDLLFLQALHDDTVDKFKELGNRVAVYKSGFAWLANLNTSFVN